MISRRPSTAESNQLKWDVGNDRSHALSLDSTGALTDDEQWVYRFDGLAATRGSQIEDTRQSASFWRPQSPGNPMIARAGPCWLTIFANPNQAITTPFPPRFWGCCPIRTAR